MRIRSHLLLGLSFFAMSANASFYLTAGAGGSQTTANWDIKTSAAFVAPNSATQQYILPYGTDSSEEDQGGIGQLGAGYGFYISKIGLFVGLEASVTGISPQPKVDNIVGMQDVYQYGGPNIFTAQMQSSTTLHVVDPDINISLKLGKKMSPYSMLYVKGGAVFNELELQSKTDFVYINPSASPNILNSSMDVTETKKVTGFNGALGLEHLISRYVAVNLEYTYVDYGTITVTGTAPTSSTIQNGTSVIVDPDGLVTDSEASVNRQSVMLGIIVYFGKQYD